MAKKLKTEKSNAGAANPSPSSGSIFKKAEIDPTLASLFADSSKPSHSIKSKGTSNGDSKSDTKTAVKKSAAGKQDSSVASEGEELIFEESASASELEDSESIPNAAITSTQSNRKRKRGQADEDIEGQYMQRLAREEAKEQARLRGERQEKRRKESRLSEELSYASDSAEEEDSKSQDEDQLSDGSDDEVFEIPQHESVAPPTESSEFEKASRTVFLGNVTSQAITSKSAKKALLKHLSSFFESLPPHDPPHKVESIRFRSTAYSNKIPKKAAFAKKELMDATTRSTNAYVVYSTKVAAKEAAVKLNGTVVLDRHLRVDEVAHPAKNEPRRCLFVGNLGFVDDESQIQAAEEQDGKKKQKKKEPSDVEEGLWREFGKVGKVESVRVIRDPKTRVGKGFAYVQFTDENAVEAALLYNDKKFPPLLPRKLRVMRAKSIKRNASKQGPSRPAANGVYNPKVSTREKSMLGRASKMLGRAGAASVRRGDREAKDVTERIPGLKTPESFVFEGHRASSKQGGAGLKIRGSGKSKGKPKNRSSKRAAAWKAGGGKKG